MYQPLLRADFTLFDSYPEHACPTYPTLKVPMVAYYGTGDRRVTQPLVAGWQRWAASSFTCTPVSGNHLWPLDREHKQAWLKHIVDELDRVAMESME